MRMHGQPRCRGGWELEVVEEHEGLEECADVAGTHETRDRAFSMSHNTMRDMPGSLQ
jgi:hypothetical protein